MGDVIKVNRVEKQDSNTDVKKINNGIGDSVYECMKMLANKSKLPFVEQLLRGKTVPEYTLNEVGKHHDSTSCWMVVSDKVYDVTDFLYEHPGGEEIIIENAGCDATVPYTSKGHSTHADDLLEKYCIGELVKEDNVFSIAASLPYGPPVNTDIDYYRTFFGLVYFCKCCEEDRRHKS